MMEDVILLLREKLGNKITNCEEKTKRRVYLDIAPSDIPEAVGYAFKDLKCRFITATGIDTVQGLEILYHFTRDQQGKVFSLRTIIKDKKQPKIQSITPIIRGAEWIEREMWELLGINFEGHPNLTHLLLIDEWPEGEYPLRHDQEHKRKERKE